jgi:hypothetical protein
MKRSCELHFQEGFTGQTVTLAVDGQARSAFEARTRTQTGLARIETLEAGPGQTITVGIPEYGIQEDCPVTAHLDRGDPQFPQRHGPCHRRSHLRPVPGL